MWIYGATVGARRCGKRLATTPTMLVGGRVAHPAFVTEYRVWTLRERRHNDPVSYGMIYRWVTLGRARTRFRLDP